MMNWLSCGRLLSSPQIRFRLRRRLLPRRRRNAIDMTASENKITEPWFQSPAMTAQEFQCFSQLIYTRCGIHLSPVKRTMLTARLSKRLRALGMQSFRQYYDYLSTARGRSEELSQMINVVTTNKTEFFREAKHFDLLRDRILPSLTESERRLRFRKLQVWSAGCSTGEEPYTLAMVLREFGLKRRGFDFSILATDISTRVLEIAQHGVYSEEVVQPVPPGLRQKYLMRGRESHEGFFRVVPELRNRIAFQYLNLNDGSFGISMPMDIIFCRNVIIYFDRNIQKSLFEKLYTQLNPGGYLFVGHSETLHGINNQFIHVAASVYKKSE